MGALCQAPLAGTLQWCTNMEIFRSLSNPKFLYRIHIRKYKIMNSIAH